MFRIVFYAALFAVISFAVAPGFSAKAQDLQPANTILGAPADQALTGDDAMARDDAPESAPEPAPAQIETRTLNLGTAQSPLAQPPAIDPADIPQVLLDEITRVEELCRGNFMYSSFHDCGCIAVKFLDARIKSDPKTSRDVVFREVAPLCINQVGIVDYVYPPCHDIVRLRKPQTYRQICECTARTVTANYTANPQVNLHYIERLRDKAMVECGRGL